MSNRAVAAPTALSLISRQAVRRFSHALALTSQGQETGAHSTKFTGTPDSECEMRNARSGN